MGVGRHKGYLHLLGNIIQLQVVSIKFAKRGNGGKQERKKKEKKPTKTHKSDFTLQSMQKEDDERDSSVDPTLEIERAEREQGRGQIKAAPLRKKQVLVVGFMKI